MKKIITLLLVLVGYVGTLSATGTVLHLVSTLNGFSGDDNENTYLFSYYWDSGNNQEVYEYTITSTQLATLSGGDLYFRPNFWDEWGQRCPTSNSDDPYDFSDNGQWSTKGSNGGQSGAFKIPHSTLKASSYRITVYRKTGDGAGAWIKVEIVSMPITIGSTGKATFSCDRALNFSGKGIDAYLITGASAGTLTQSDALTLVPANTGLYLEGAEGTVDVPVVETSTASGVDVSANMLKVGTGASVSQTDGDYTNFILSTNKGESATPKFYKVNTAGNTVAVGKAYLQIPTASVGARDFFWFDDDVTAIDAVKQEVKANGEYFNLAGQRVAQPTKGLYIVNGKKYIVK